MFPIKAIHTPTVRASILLTGVIIAMISVSIMKFNSVPHVPILFAILLLFGYGLLKRITYKELERGLVNGASDGFPLQKLHAFSLVDLEYVGHLA